MNAYDDPSLTPTITHGRAWNVCDQAWGVTGVAWGLSCGWAATFTSWYSVTVTILLGTAFLYMVAVTAQDDAADRDAFRWAAIVTGGILGVAAVMWVLGRWVL